MGHVECGSTPCTWVCTRWRRRTNRCIGVFGDDMDAYDERPDGQSACAGLIIDQDGRLAVDSSVLSSALWAVARIHDPGPQDPGWADGFDHAQARFVDAVDDFEGRRREDAAAERAPMLDTTSLSGLLRVAHEAAGITGMDGLATDRVVIQSSVISEQQAANGVENDFLNSFYLDDLALVRSRVADEEPGAALTGYPQATPPSRSRTASMSSPGQTRWTPVSRSIGCHRGGGRPRLIMHWP